MGFCRITSDSAWFVQNLGDWIYGIIRCMVQDMVGLALRVGSPYVFGVADKRLHHLKNRGTLHEFLTEPSVGSTAAISPITQKPH